MNPTPYPAGTTHAQARERQEFDGIRAFAPLGESDPAWTALRTARKQLDETEDQKRREFDERAI